MHRWTLDHVIDHIIDEHMCNRLQRMRSCPSMHVIHRKLYKEKLDAEEHHAGAEAVRSQTKFVLCYQEEVVSERGGGQAHSYLASNH